MNKKSVRDIELNGKRVFVRVDFNVPVEDGKITDDKRIRETLPTINYLIEKGAKVILASHFGRPKGQVVESMRLTAAGVRLSELLNKPVVKVDEAVGEAVKAKVAELKNGDVLLLENVRFYPGEEKNDPELAKQFAELADIFVNDAFGAAHRAHASTEGIAHLLPAVSGLLMERELSVIGKALSNPDRPFTAIIGGSKVKDKIDVIDNLLNIADNVIIGGGLTYTFFKAQGHEVVNLCWMNPNWTLLLDLLKKRRSLAKTSTFLWISLFLTISALQRTRTLWTSTAFLQIGKAWISDRKLAKSMQMLSKTPNWLFGMDQWVYLKSSLSLAVLVK